MSTLERIDELATGSDLTESDVDEVAQKVNRRGRQRVDRYRDRAE